MSEKMILDVNVTSERHEADEARKGYTTEKPVCDTCTEKPVCDTCTDKPTCAEYLPGAVCVVDRGGESSGC